MKEKLFEKILCGVILLGLVLTLLHLGYIVNAYRHCSIIYFIARELW